MILNGSYNIGFTIDLALKDLGFAMQFGREFGVPLDVAGLVEQTFMRSKAEYGGGAWSPQWSSWSRTRSAPTCAPPGSPRNCNEHSDRRPNEDRPRCRASLSGPDFSGFTVVAHASLARAAR